MLDVARTRNLVVAERYSFQQGQVLPSIASSVLALDHFQVLLALSRSLCVLPCSGMFGVSVAALEMFAFQPVGVARVGWARCGILVPLTLNQSLGEEFGVTVAMVLERFAFQLVVVAFGRSRCASDHMMKSVELIRKEFDVLVDPVVVALGMPVREVGEVAANCPVHSGGAVKDH